ncbi:hypothetical protein [Pseudomonas violetae]|jgi:outer membrane lipoprotein SlyB|uniref:Glycine zipper domain-containing protein n=1 Tax=Pseudomonas violetae TaxID=2915813 RepID=A0ABT0EX24_9PSED|nr:hypothetical protein [Pseudomonas violetae]MCK1790281.1 hypothetical protein [Pseudomonas violetae]
MKLFYAVTLTIGIFLFQLSHASADEVLSQAEDTTAGAAFGAGTGVLIGGAAGGPLGAIIGAALGIFGGREVQKAAGLEERAYAVRSNTGEERVVRSPRKEFAIGQEVEVKGNRMHAPSPQ